MAFQPVRGMRDLQENETVKREFIIDICKIVFENFGFVQWDTPALEDYNLLSMKGGGGDAIKEEIYYFRDKKNREIGMRFDLTLPFARIMASNPSLLKPVKRYQIGKVWRYDRPQKMRYREFMQADVDIAGCATSLADVECVAVLAEIFRRLELDAKIRVNNRGALEALAEKAGVRKGEIAECFRSLDKADKIGWAGVRKELVEKKIDPRIATWVEQKKVPELMKIIGEKEEKVREINEFLQKVEEAGYGKEVVFDLSLARGLAYYTGWVFEATGKEGVSLAAGGRYDDLIERVGGPSTPAVGVSLGIDRILDVLQDKTIAGNFVIMYVIPVGKPAQEAAMKIANVLRSMGIGTEMDIMERGVGKNLEFANKKGIPFALIIGEEELKQGKVVLREMKSGKETRYSLGDLDALAEQAKGLL